LKPLRKALLFAAVVASVSATAQKEGVPPAQAPLVSPPAPGFVFPTHETLTYTVDWRVFTAGKAVFQLDQAGSLVKVQASADTVGATNMIYQVIDRFQSSFNPQTGCSAGFSKQTQEGRRKISSDLVFTPGATASTPVAGANAALGTQALVEHNLIKNTTKQQQGQIPACVIDSLSGIFYAGSQKLTIGQDFKLPLADAMRTVAVTMKVEAREDVKTPAGTFTAIRVQPTADAGVVKNRGTITVWYSDDARHLPVQIRAKLFWGTITFHLQSFETH
jgi:peptidyl-tRNA hydrolase